MALAHSIKNTDKPYQCISCGTKNVSIVREDSVNPRCKCNNCQFMFDGQDSLAAQEAGAIQPSSPESLAAAAEPESEYITPSEPSAKALEIARDRFAQINAKVHVPKAPSHVFVAKDGTAEFCSKRYFKKTAIRWSQGNKFDVYELHPIKLQVDVNLA